MPAFSASPISNCTKRLANTPGELRRFSNDRRPPPLSSELGLAPVAGRRGSREAPLPSVGGTMGGGGTVQEWSEPSTVAFMTESAAPLQPSPIVLADGGAGSHTLRLLCAGLHGCGSAITCVRLELHTGEEGMEETFYQSFPGVERGATSAVLAARGLASHTKYRLRARAGNRAGEGPWSLPVELSTLSELAEPMAAPRAWSKSAYSVILVWLPPSDLVDSSTRPGTAAIFERSMSDLSAPAASEAQAFVYELQIAQPSSKAAERTQPRIARAIEPSIADGMA